jgi:transposase-like protein
MGKKNYTDEFKKLAVQKYLSKGNRSLDDLSAEIGAPISTIFSWVEKYTKSDNINSMIRTPKRPRDWSAEEKIRACIEYERLSDEERGAFLRSEGLHSSKVLEWRQQCVTALEDKNNAHASRNKLSDANRKLKELEQDLRRKEKALAEAAALLMLKKKADSIWGIEENS